MIAYAMRKPVFHLCVALLLIVALAVVDVQRRENDSDPPAVPTTIR